MAAFHLTMGYLHLGNMEVVECGDLVRLCHYLQARHVGCVEAPGYLVPNIAAQNQIWPIQDWVVFCESMVGAEGDFRTSPNWRDGGVYLPTTSHSRLGKYGVFFVTNVDARKGP